MACQKFRASPITPSPSGRTVMSAASSAFWQETQVKRRGGQAAVVVAEVALAAVSAEKFDFGRREGVVGDFEAVAALGAAVFGEVQEEIVAVDAVHS